MANSDESNVLDIFWDNYNIKKIIFILASTKKSSAKSSTTKATTKKSDSIDKNLEKVVADSYKDYLKDAKKSVSDIKEKAE